MELHLLCMLIQHVFNSLQLSKPIMSEEGKKLGLIDAIVPSQELLKVSRQWALDISERRKPWLRSLHRTDKIGSLSEAREVLKAARQQAKKIAPNMPQHQALLDVMEEGIIHGGYNGVLKVLLSSGFAVCRYRCEVFIREQNVFAFSGLWLFFSGMWPFY